MINVGEILDVRNKPCPMPVLLTKKKLEKMGAGEVLEVVGNDRVSKSNILRYATKHGQEILEEKDEGREFKLLIKRSEEKLPEEEIKVCG